MKKIIVLSLLTISLFADINQVQTYYDAGEYEDAIKEAKESKNEYSNPTLHLLWAKSAQKLGRDNDAMSAYERVEMLDENNIQARIALAKLYKKTGRDELALAESKELQNYQLTPQQRASLDTLRSGNLQSVKAYGALAFGYDTNINVASQNLTGGANNSIETGFAQFNGSVSYVNELEERGGWYARGDLQLYDQTNFDSNASNYNMLVGGLSAGAGYAGDGYDFYLPLGYNTIHYLNKNLLSTINIKPRLNYTISDELILNAQLSLASHTYTKKDNLNNRDDRAIGGSGGVYYLMGNDYVFANVKYESFSATSSVVGSFVDRNILSTTAGINYNLTSWLVTKANYRFNMGSYDTQSRSDKFNQLDIKFSHYFAELFEVYLMDTYSKNSSNLSAYEYTKNIFLFGLALNY